MLLHILGMAPAYSGAIRFAIAPYAPYFPAAFLSARVDPLLPTRPVGLEEIQDVAVDAQRHVLLCAAVAGPCRTLYHASINEKRPLCYGLVAPRSRAN